MDYTGDINISHESLVKHIDTFAQNLLATLSINPENVDEISNSFDVLTQHYQSLQISIEKYESSLKYLQEFDLNDRETLPCELSRWDEFHVPDSWMEQDITYFAYAKIVNEAGTKPKFPFSTQYISANSADLDHINAIDFKTPYTTSFPTSTLMQRLTTDAYTLKDLHNEIAMKKQEPRGNYGIAPPRLLTPSQVALVDGLRKVLEIQDIHQKYHIVYQYIEEMKEILNK